MAWKHLLSFVTTLTPAVGWGECLWTLVTPVKAIMVGVGLGKNQHLFSSLVFVCLISSKFIASYPKNIFPWWHLNATQFLTEQRTSSGQEKVCFGARHNCSCLTLYATLDRHWSPPNQRTNIQTKKYFAHDRLLKPEIMIKNILTKS